MTILEKNSDHASRQESKEDLRAKIAARAYEIYEREGQPRGRAMLHWLAAEREILGAAEPRPRAGKPRWRSLGWSEEVHPVGVATEHWR